MNIGLYDKALGFISVINLSDLFAFKVSRKQLCIVKEAFLTFLQDKNNNSFDKYSEELRKS